MTRLGSLADQLSAIRTFIQVPDHEPEPLQTNWSVTPANDNNPEDLEGLKIDKLWDISPSIGEMMKQTKEFSEEKNQSGQTIRWGNLRFSDGGQTEQGFKLTIDGKIVVYQFVVPPGGMLGTTDKERAQRGGDENPEDVSGSQAYFAGAETEYRPAGLFKAIKARPVRRTKRKERTGPKTKEEERQWLEDAISGTEVMPEVKKCPDGFPASPASLSQLFPGMVKVCTGQSGSQAWTDIASMREERSDWFRWVDGLKDEDKRTIELVRTAKTYADVTTGEKSERTARRRGKQSIIAANDNLMAAMKKYSS